MIMGSSQKMQVLQKWSPKKQTAKQEQRQKQPDKPVLRLPSIRKKRRQYAIPSSKLSREELRQTLVRAQRGELPYIYSKKSKSPTQSGGNSRYQEIYVNWKSIRRALGKHDNLSPSKIRLVPAARFYEVVARNTSLSTNDAMAVAEPFLTSGKRGTSHNYVDWRRLIKRTLELFQQK